MTGRAIPTRVQYVEREKVERVARIAGPTSAHAQALASAGPNDRFFYDGRGKLVVEHRP